MKLFRMKPKSEVRSRSKSNSPLNTLYTPSKDNKQFMESSYTKNFKRGESTRTKKTALTSKWKSDIQFTIEHRISL
jgi:hypothetical protein